MKEYVERDKILDQAYYHLLFRKSVNDPYGVDAVDEDDIKAIPAADVVEIVRCLECEYWDRDWKSYISGENKHFCPMINLITDADFFCKDGKCKGKGGDE